MTKLPAPESDAEVQTRVVGRVLVVRLCRPVARNAMTDSMAAAVAAAMDRLDSVADLAVGVLTGSDGDFCVGMDLRAAGEGQLGRGSDRGFGGLVERPPRKPLIAAVEGYAIGGGLELALACDLIVAARDARFGIPEVRRGRIAAAGGLFRLPELIGRQRTMELALTGELVTAEHAASYGLINRVSAPGAAVDVALELAALLAANAPLAMAASKEIVLHHREWPQHEVWARQDVIAASVRESADAREGINAFIDKREPRWCGK